MLFCVNFLKFTYKNTWKKRHCLGHDRVHCGSAVCSGPNPAALRVVHTQPSCLMLQKLGFQSTVECWGFCCWCGYSMSCILNIKDIIKIKRECLLFYFLSYWCVLIHNQPVPREGASHICRIQALLKAHSLSATLNPAESDPQW